MENTKYGSRVVGFAVVAGLGLLLEGVRRTRKASSDPLLAQPRETAAPTSLPATTGAPTSLAPQQGAASTAAPAPAPTSAIPASEVAAIVASDPAISAAVSAAAADVPTSSLAPSQVASIVASSPAISAAVVAAAGLRRRAGAGVRGYNPIPENLTGMRF